MATEDNRPQAGTSTRERVSAEDDADAARIADYAVTMFADEAPRGQSDASDAASRSADDLDDAGDDTDTGEEPTGDDAGDAEGDQQQAEEGEEDAKPDEAEAEGEDDPPTADDSAVHEVKIDGETRKVTTKELRDGYMRQADYSRKTAAAASERSELAKFREAAVGAARTWAQRAKAIDPVISEGLKTDWRALANSIDPIAEPGKWVAFQAKRERFVTAMDEVERVERAASEEQTKLDGERLLAEEKELIRKLPDWADQGKREGLIKKFDKFLEKEGFSKEDRDLISDHRALLIVQKAMRWDERMESLKKARGKIKTAADPVRSARPTGTTNRTTLTRSQVQLRERAEREGDPRDIADYFVSTSRR